MSMRIAVFGEFEVNQASAKNFEVVHNGAIVFFANSENHDWNREIAVDKAKQMNRKAEEAKIAAMFEEIDGAEEIKVSVGDEQVKAIAIKTGSRIDAKAMIREMKQVARVGGFKVVGRSQHGKISRGSRQICAIFIKEK